MYKRETTYLYLRKEKFRYGTPGAKRKRVSTIRTYAAGRDNKNNNGSARTVGGGPCRPRRWEKVDHRCALLENGGWRMKPTWVKMGRKEVIADTSKEDERK
jgi:hypothetical protein